MASDLLNPATTETNRFQDFPENLQWMFRDNANQNESPKSNLDNEFASAGLNYRQPTKPKDGTCLFRAISNQLKHMGKPPQTTSQLRTDVVRFLRSNPTTPTSIHFREFVNHGGWKIHLKRMSMDGKWGDYIALLGLVNMLDVHLAHLGYKRQSVVPMNGQDDRRDNTKLSSMSGSDSKITRTSSYEQTSQCTLISQDHSQVEIT